MTETALRNELHSFIDIIPERKLHVLKSLLSVLAEEPFVIETDLTKEEKEIIADGRREYAEHPESFTPWSKVRKG
jgi:16S rRNA C1402 (ribose-2'-O) methylase RsmI